MYKFLPIASSYNSMLKAATRPAASIPAPHFCPRLNAILFAVVVAVAEVVAEAEVEDATELALEVAAGTFIGLNVPH